MNEKRLDIIFDGKSASREEFLGEVKKKMFSFFGLVDGVKVYMFTKEMIKNIFDHADAIGECHFKKEEGFVSFEIKDHGTKSYDIDTLKKNGTTKPENKYNFGKGLTDIESLKSIYGATLVINAEKGFCYTGTFPLKY